MEMSLAQDGRLTRIGTVINFDNPDYRKPIIRSPPLIQVSISSEEKNEF